MGSKEDIMDGYDPRLTPILGNASREDLQPLIDYMKAGTENPDFTAPEDEEKWPAFLQEKLGKFAEDKFTDLFRISPTYFEIVKAVANKFDVDIPSVISTEELEIRILLRILAKVWEKMPEEVRLDLLTTFEKQPGKKFVKSAMSDIENAIKENKFYGYALSVIIANGLSKAILHHELEIKKPSPFNLYTGEFSAFFEDAWKLLDTCPLTENGACYRIIIPCVIHIAFLRQKNSRFYCENCHHAYYFGDTYCSNCGQELPKTLAQAVSKSLKN